MSGYFAALPPQYPWTRAQADADDLSAAERQFLALHEGRDALEVGGAPATINQVSFVLLLLSLDNDAVMPPPDSSLAEPLVHYWIATSHNSYILSGDQLTGRASAEAIRRHLLLGCRTLKLDLWDGSRCPVVTHGYTFVTVVDLSEVLRAIAECAFETSELPVILTLQLNCGKREDEVATLLIEHLGHVLLTFRELRAAGEAAKASSLALKRRVLLRSMIKVSPPDRNQDPSVSPRRFWRCRKLAPPRNAIHPTGVQLHSSSEHRNQLIVHGEESETPSSSGGFRAFRRSTSALSLVTPRFGASPLPSLSTPRLLTRTPGTNQRLSDLICLRQLPFHAVLRPTHKQLGDSSPSPWHGPPFHAVLRLTHQQSGDSTPSPRHGPPSSLKTASSSVMREEPGTPTTNGAAAKDKAVLPHQMCTSIVQEDRLLGAMGFSADQKGAAEGLKLATNARTRRSAALLSFDPPAGVEAVQKRTGTTLLCVQPHSFRLSGSNMNPLPCWLAGVQQVGLNMSVNDLPLQVLSSPSVTHHPGYLHVCNPLARAGQTGCKPATLTPPSPPTQPQATPPPPSPSPTITTATTHARVHAYSHSHYHYHSHSYSTPTPTPL